MINIEECSLQDDKFTDTINNIKNTLINKQNELSVMTCCGESCIKLSDIINTINNVANIEGEVINKECNFCREYWTNKGDITSKRCLGSRSKSKIPCNEYKSIVN